MNNKGSHPVSPMAAKPIERPGAGSQGHQPNTGSTPDEHKFPVDPESPGSQRDASTEPRHNVAPGDDVAGPQKESKAEGEDFEALTDKNTIPKEDEKEVTQHDKIPAQDKRDVNEKAPLSQEESEENNDVEEQSPDSILAGKAKNPDEHDVVDKSDKYPFPNK
jgi:hypothetical protein